MTPVDSGVATSVDAGEGWLEVSRVVGGVADVRDLFRVCLV